MYKIIRTVLFFFDPEAVHYFSMNALRIFCKIPGGQNLLAALFKAKTQVKTVFGIEFKNTVGLGAGFDKNASYLNELTALGFGFVEIGTVTPKPQAGNDKPRLFRLPKDKALLNRMGFNNGIFKLLIQAYCKVSRQSPSCCCPNYKINFFFFYYSIKYSFIISNLEFYIY